MRQFEPNADWTYPIASEKPFQCKNLIQTLSLDSLQTLFRFKSFFLLVFAIAWADRVLRPLLEWPGSGYRVTELMDRTSDIVIQMFEYLPGRLMEVLVNPKTAFVLFLLFLIKQIISLWPSSDMRRIHRQERESFGLWRFILVITWRQILWDAAALSSLCSLAVIWTLAIFFACRAGWMRSAASIWAIVFVVLTGVIFPQVLAGLSFSSKLAVLQRGNFSEKLQLFFKIFTDLRLSFPVWAFFTLRILVEIIFVFTIPGLILLNISNVWLRLLMASLAATPVYAFLKMISFKFFLLTYKDSRLVYEEYARYYNQNSNLIC